MHYCKNCGFTGKGKKKTPGIFAVELILWFCFILPGLAFSIWRATNKYYVCPSCGEKVISANSPIAQKAIARQSKKQNRPAPISTTIPEAQDDDQPNVYVIK